MPAEDAWALVQYTEPDRPTPAIGLLTGGKVTVAPEPLAGRTLLDVLEDWEQVSSWLHGWTPDGAVLPAATVICPLTYPGKVLGAGANYYSHAREMGTDRPDPQADPFFFLKPPRTTLIGPTDPIPYPAYEGVQLDWEAELAVVIGRRAHHVGEADARAHIAGYLVANDVSARDRATRAGAVSPIFASDWLAHKGQDGFCPLGPGLVPAWLVPDPQDLRIRLQVNGVLKQDATTADMVVGVDRLVAAASVICTLEPGDVILTGTPAGVGMPHDDYLRPGDVCQIEISGVGRLENEVLAP